MKDNGSQIIEDVKWFLFDDEEGEVKNDRGFSHGLKFVSWCDEHSFIISDSDGTEYRIRVEKE